MDAVQHSPGSGLQITTASWRDVGDLHRLEKECFGEDAWPLLDVIGVLTFPGIIRLKAVREESMVGFIGADLRQRQQTAWIATFAVLPAFRRTGIGTALLKVCESGIELPAIRLSVRRSNTPAIGLYQKQGYRQINCWPKYYQGNEDALIFEKIPSTFRK